MTLDPNQRNVHQIVSIAPSPATSGTDFHIDHATTYRLNSFEQTAPFKITVYPQHELPTKDNSEIILVTAYTSSTRTGGVSVAEVIAGYTPGGSVDIQTKTSGSSSNPAQSEVQTITLDATAGTYTLSFGGNTTAAINYNDTAATVQTRLRALASIGSTGCTVSGSAGGPYDVTFAGSLANTDVQPITADATNLTTGALGTAAVTRLTAGGVSTNEVQQIQVTATSGTWTATFGGNTTNSMDWNVSADTLSLELQALASIGSGNVSVEATGGLFSITFQGTLGNAGQSLITTDASLLTTGGVNEVQTVTVDGDGGTFKLSADGGSNYTSSLAYNASASTVQTALRGLTAIGSGNCVVDYDSDQQIYTVTFCGGKANTNMAALTADASSLTVTTAHITSCLRAQNGTTARSIVVGDHVEVAVLPDAPSVEAVLAFGSTHNDWAPSGYASAGKILAYVFGGSGANPIITGLAGGTDGRRVTITAAGLLGTEAVQINFGDSGSAAGNRFYGVGHGEISGSMTLAWGETIEFEWDGTQGNWLAVTTTHVATSGDSAPGLVKLAGGSGSAADDGAVVHLAGTETITGAKTFSAGPLVSDPAAFGYTTGAGGTVTQLTSKTTSVTLNTAAGQITMYSGTGGSIAAGATAVFLLTNSTIGAADVVAASFGDGGTAAAYTLAVSNLASGHGCRFAVTNITAGGLNEAVVINFVVIKGATS